MSVATLQKTGMHCGYKPVSRQHAERYPEITVTIPKHMPPMLTPQEVAEHLRTTRKAVYEMAQRGQLPSVTRIGRRLLFRTDAFLAWLDARTTRFDQRRST